MLTVSKVLILRATAMKEEYCPADPVKPSSCPCVVACFTTLLCIPGGWEGVALHGGEKVNPGGADGSVQHHGQLRRLLSLLSHPVTWRFEAGWRGGEGVVEVGNGCWRPRRFQLQAASDVFTSLTEAQLHTLCRRWSYISHARNDASEGARLLEQPTAVAKHLSPATWQVASSLAPICLVHLPGDALR